VKIYAKMIVNYLIMNSSYDLTAHFRNGKMTYEKILHDLLW